MAFDEPLHGMYDPRLKPRLLSSITAAHLPDDRQPPKSPAELSLAVSMIRRHHLLFEPSMNQPSNVCPPGRTVDGYKGAVDAWIERVIVLISSTTTEKSWAGVCLLGVTCQECTQHRFLESYSAWFQKLVLHLKPIDPLFVRGAACASLTDLLTRLGALIEFAGVRREGTGLSAKLAQLVLQLLAEEGSKSIWEDGIDLLLTILKYFPASLKQQTSQVEALLVGKLMDAEMNTSLSQKYARCLALLPKAHGDAATWNSLLRRILLAINTHLDDAFLGMEDGALGKEVVSALMPRGQDQTWFLGGVSGVTSATSDWAKKFWQLLVPRVSVLMKCCHYLLVNAYPVQVPVPLSALLALVARILSVDGSPYRAAPVLGVPVSSAQQATLCCELPALHACALDLLRATVSGVRSQLLPRAADIVRLLSAYFQRCGSPNLRITLYNISKHLLISLGVGMASAFAPVLIDNSLSDLKGALSASASNVSGSTYPTNPRKRKDPNNMQMEISCVMAAIDAGPDINDTPLALATQIAALEAIEALLTVGGSLRSEHWRAEVDSVVANVAMVASSGALSCSLMVEDISSKGESHTYALGSFQLAAYKALLASILSPCTHRPPFLSQGLMIFRKGRQEAAGTEVAEFCAHALLALEPLLHPRSLPCVTMPSPQVNVPRGRAMVPNNSTAREPVVAGEIPSATMNHGYSQPLASSLKVGDTAMELEVEGDPYVQEDIESWIIDYGGEQGMLNDSSTMLAAFQRDLQQAMENTPVATGEVNVCARQSLANDEDGMMGDMLPETQDVPRSQAMDMARGKVEVNSVADMPSLFSTQLRKTGKEIVNFPHAQEPGVLEVSVPTVVEQGREDTLKDMDSLSTHVSTFTPLPSGITKAPEDFVLEGSKVAFSVNATNVPESDSDAIPDIVDGDPDLD